MAKVTWNGSDSIVQWDITFKKGEAVEVSDPAIWTRAQGDPAFKVEVPEPKAAPKVVAKSEPAVTMTSKK